MNNQNTEQNDNDRKQQDPPPENRQKEEKRKSPTLKRVRDFQILDKIGEGTFSSVYKAMRDSDKQMFALKRIKIQKLCDKDKDNALNEIRLQASLRDPHIIRYKEAFIEEDTDCLMYVFINIKQHSDGVRRQL